MRLLEAGLMEATRLNMLAAEMQFSELVRDHTQFDVVPASTVRNKRRWALANDVLMALAGSLGELKTPENARSVPFAQAKEIASMVGTTVQAVDECFRILVRREFADLEYDPKDSYETWCAGIMGCLACDARLFILINMGSSLVPQSELVSLTGLTKQTVSHHMRELHRWELVQIYGNQRRKSYAADRTNLYVLANRLETLYGA
jgi:hypothetical protein